MSLSTVFPDKFMLGMEIRTKVCEYVHQKILALRSRATEVGAFVVVVVVVVVGGGVFSSSCSCESRRIDRLSEKSETPTVFVCRFL